MTDKEWYAQISTMVLDGINRVNEGKDTWRNQYDIRQFVTTQVTQNQMKARARRKVFLNLSKAMQTIGYICGFSLVLASSFGWIICLSEGYKLIVPAVTTLIAAIMGGLGLVGQIWYDLLF